jgi:hypothetical protein
MIVVHSRVQDYGPSANTDSITTIVRPNVIDFNRRWWCNYRSARSTPNTKASQTKKEDVRQGTECVAGVSCSKLCINCAIKELNKLLLSDSLQLFDTVMVCEWLGRQTPDNLVQWNCFYYCTMASETVTNWMYGYSLRSTLYIGCAHDLLERRHMRGWIWAARRVSQRWECRELCRIWKCDWFDLCDKQLQVGSTSNDLVIQLSRPLL